MSISTMNTTYGCPGWCKGGHSAEDSHSTRGADVELSLAEPFEVQSGPDERTMISDYMNVSVWQGDACAVPDQPCVSVRHADDELPDMTPAEAMRLAIALAQAARDAMASYGTPALGAAECPPWCETPDHRAEDGGRMLHTLVVAAGAVRYPYEVEGARLADSVLVTRAQARDQEPVIIIERPAGDADDPDGHLSDLPAVSVRQLMLSTGEAVDLAVGLLGLTADPQGLLAMYKENGR
jgi:hypothetical protein